MARSIVKSSSLYAAGTVARAASSIIMLPIYTRYLSPEIYGTAELLNLVLDLTILVLGARITTGMFKFYSDAKEQKSKNTVLSTCLWLGLSVNTLAIIVLWLIAPTLSSLLNSPEMSKPLQWFAFTLAFGTMAEIGMGYFRVNDQAGRYLGFSLLKLTLQIGASLYFIVHLELGLWGIIYASLFSGGIQTLLLLAFVLPQIGIKYSPPLAMQLIKYSLPIIYGSIAMYYMTFGDRYFIQHYNGLAEVGIYALGYKFGFMLTALVWSPFMSYWGARQFDHAKEPNSAATFSDTFYTANYVLWAIATGMVIFLAPTIHLMADSAYYKAIDIAPYIILAYLFQCWTEYHRFGILESGNTKYLNYYTWVAAIVISVLYVLLIPLWGGVGAAIATAITMFIRFLLVYKKSQQYFVFSTNWLKVSLLIGLSVASLQAAKIAHDGSTMDFAYSAITFTIIVLISFLLKLSPFNLSALHKIKP